MALSANQTTDSASGSPVNGDGVLTVHDGQRESFRPASLDLKQPVAVVGLGATGLSCIRYLVAQDMKVHAVDSAANPAAAEVLRHEFPNVALSLGSLDALRSIEAGTVVLSPGVWAGHDAVRAARDAGAMILGDIELFAKAADAPVVAITGSNGKSTVTTLVARMLAADDHEVRAGGNLAPPALELLGDTPPDFYVLELSSFQLETTYSLRPVVATVLNLSPDHMDRYEGFEEYVAAKARIFDGEGVMVVNRDDDNVMALSRDDRRVVSYGLDAPEEGDFGVREVQGKRWLAHGHTLLARVDALPLPGAHNVSNALAALAIGESLGLSLVATIGALLDFKGLPHRCEVVAKKDGVRWINDSKGTNVGATCAAIEGLGEADNLVLIAGGEGKDADFAPLARSSSGRVRHMVLFGRDAGLIQERLGGSVPVQRAGDLQQAVNIAKQLSKPGDIVLFSPACASFDMFRNYEVRGEAFSQLAREVTSA